MTERNFMEMLKAKWPETLLCVGLDTDPEKISREIEALIRKDDKLPPSESIGPLMRGYNARVIEATKDLVCAYKPNFAFYEAHGLQGLWALKETVAFIKTVAPDVPIIGDAKRGDIGKTNLGYIKAAFDVYGVDAMTVHPYLGQEEGMQVFLDRRDKGIIVLCRTSNKGAREFQDLLTLPADFFDNESIWLTSLAWVQDQALPLYQRVAKNVAQNWNANGNCAVVAGATYAEDIKVIRKIIGDDMPILIPGVGTQGGDLEKAVKNGINSKGDGIIINSSSGILYKSTGPDFAQAARMEAKRLRDEINKYRKSARRQ
ncbi:MAG: orotidine-5'-phosphate decarboxylase [Candidatus Spechtbacterales bacterium]